MTYLLLKFEGTNILEYLPQLIRNGQYRVVGNYLKEEDALVAGFYALRQNIKEREIDVWFEVVNELGVFNEYPGVYADPGHLQSGIINDQMRQDMLSSEFDNIRSLFSAERRGAFSIRFIEESAGIPAKTLDHLIAGRRVIPDKHLLALMRTLYKLNIGYIPTIHFASNVSDIQI